MRSTRPRTSRVEAIEVVGASPPGQNGLGYYADHGKLIYAGPRGHRDDRQGSYRSAPPPGVVRPQDFASERPATTQRLALGSRLVLSRVHWVEPKLVAEITYLTWTADGLLRHTVYVGLRGDKPVLDVRREASGNR